MNKKFGRLYIYIIVFFVTAAIYSCILYVKISNLEFKPEPPEYVMDIEKIEVNYGDSFDSALAKSRLSESDKTEIKKELAKLGFRIGKINSGDFFEVVYSTASGQWTNFWYHPSGDFFYSIKKSTDDSIEASKKLLGRMVTDFNASGTIASSLWAAMAEQDVPANIIMSFADIFAWQMDFLTDTRKEDTFKVFYQIETVSKKDTRLSSKIIAAQYKSGAKIYNAILFKTSDGKYGYFDENGKSVKSAFLKAPLQFSRISSFFNPKRMHPILKIPRPHLGIDYAAPTGTPVSSIGDGTVKKSEYSGGYGNLVVVKHSNGYETYYGHLLKYGRGIKRGARVNQGQIIGYVGSTGLSTGPHLDFRISKNGKFINFLTMSTPPTTTLSGKDKEAFDSFKDEIFAKLD
ncbi:MAG: peptidoglycan DD-metalloendopeptidase family protein [Endomicrobia bacterium]|nr:peptidoglycan DD-metalloendopeptidase family protein [Endomicrobiia bacterium]